MNGDERLVETHTQPPAGPNLNSNPDPALDRYRPDEINLASQRQQQQQQQQPNQNQTDPPPRRSTSWEKRVRAKDAIDANAAERHGREAMLMLRQQQQQQNPRQDISGMVGSSSISSSSSSSSSSSTNTDNSNTAAHAGQIHAPPLEVSYMPASWSRFYLDYDQLNQRLLSVRREFGLRKSVSTRSLTGETHTFAEILDSEAEKIVLFYLRVQGDLARKVRGGV